MALDKDDWRLLNQEEYLKNKSFYIIDVLKYKSSFGKKVMNFHEHSEFCMDKIEELQGEAYCSKNYYHWICPRCFNDFK